MAPPQPDEHTAAHPAARIVTELSNQAIDRQIAQLNNLDVKASFLGGAALALLAGFITAIATKPPTSERGTDTAVVALVLLAATFLCAAYTWWPRSFDAPPHPRGLRERHWMDPEEVVLRAVADAIATTYDKNAAVENKKVLGIRAAIVLLGLAAVFGSRHSLNRWRSLVGQTQSDPKTPRPDPPAPQQMPRPSPPIQTQPHLANVSQRGATPDLTKVSTADVTARPDLSASLNLGEPKGGQNLTRNNVQPPPKEGS